MPNYSRPYTDNKGAYDFYIENINTSINKLLAENEKYLRIKKGIILILKRYESEIVKDKTLDLKHFNYFTSDDITYTDYNRETLNYQIKEFTSSDEYLNKRILIKHIREIVRCNKKLKRNEVRIKNYKAAKIPNVVYNRIVNRLFLHISEVVKTGIFFPLKYKIGSIVAVRQEVNPQPTLDGDFVFRINFGETKKKKKQLLAQGYTIADLWSAEKYNAVIDENISKGMTLIEAKHTAKKDPRCGIPYAVYCNEDHNFWIKHVRPEYNTVANLINYKFKPSQDFLRRFQKFAKSVINPELSYKLHRPTYKR